MNAKDLANDFVASKRPHILMVTNHGIHDWEVRSGLIDTGGQNHYVNALSDTLVELGFKVTTFNRGGFPDPVSGEMREGMRYKNSHSRIAYLEGGGSSFIRKEDLTREILLEEARFAKEILESEKAEINLIISHYWDGALLANILADLTGIKAKRVWAPHSLGALKKENFKNKPPEIVAACRFDERIACEKELLLHVDQVASTSGDISRVLAESYGRDAELFLPPCINTDVVHPLETKDAVRIYDFLEKADAVSGKNVRGRPCVLEVSRTDRTKRKDLLINAFADILKRHPQAILLLTLSPDNKPVYDECMSLIEAHKMRKNVVVIGMIPREIMSELYAIAAVYCSPSEMEGFGMSVQEACACKKATVSSSLVPFAVEYLLKDAEKEIIDGGQVQWGKAGVVVDAGNTTGFARAIGRLLSDNALRDKIAANAYETTIPYFTWPNQTRTLLAKAGVKIPKSA